jgi:hypothetical protein
MHSDQHDQETKYYTANSIKIIPKTLASKREKHDGIGFGYNI